jgi:hypothetical protein
MKCFLKDAFRCEIIIFDINTWYALVIFKILWIFIFMNNLKNMRIQPLGIIIFLSFIMCSCSRQHDYKFIAYNSTDYKIEILKIGSGENRIEISVDPNDSTELFTYHFAGTYFNFTEPLLYLFISEYSDSSRVYINKYGQVASIPDLLKKSINRIDISLEADTLGKEYIFDIRVNKPGKLW